MLLEKKVKLRAVLAFFMLAVKQRSCEQNHDNEEELRRRNACASCLRSERGLCYAYALPLLIASRRRTVRREVDDGCEWGVVAGKKKVKLLAVL